MDESGTDGPVIAISGFTAIRKKWKDFSVEWQNALYNHGLDAIHMRDRNIPEQDLVHFRDIISRYTMFGSGCLVPIDSFLRLFKDKYTKTVDSADLHCRIFAIMATLSYAARSRIPGKFDFIFDEYAQVMHEELTF